MDFGNLAQILSSLIACASLIVSIVTIRATRNSDAMKDFYHRLDDIDARLGSVEGELRHLPDKETTHRLELGMARLEGEMKAMAEAFHPVAKISDRLQEFLLEKAK